MSRQQTAIGKTIARIDESPRDPEYGGEDHGTVLIYFTDGTALKIEGSSYEEVSQHLEPLSQADVRRRNAQVQGQREQARLDRLRRQEWLSVSCDERVRRRAARKPSKFGLLMDETMADSMIDLMLSQRRMFYGESEPLTVRTPCPRCRERACENAGTKTYPAQPAVFGGDWGSGGFSVKIEGGSTDRA